MEIRDMIPKETYNLLFPNDKRQPRLSYKPSVGYKQYKANAKKTALGKQKKHIETQPVKTPRALTPNRRRAKGHARQIGRANTKDSIKRRVKRDMHIVYPEEMRDNTPFTRILNPRHIMRWVEKGGDYQEAAQGWLSMRSAMSRQWRLEVSSVGKKNKRRMLG